MSANNIDPQLREALIQAKALSVNDRASLIRELMQTDEISIVLVNGQLTVAEIVNQLKKMDHSEVAQLLLGLADWMYSKA